MKIKSMGGVVRNREFYFLPESEKKKSERFNVPILVRAAKFEPCT